MAAAKISNLLYVLTTFIIGGAHGAYIQFFEYENFTGLVWDSFWTGSCNNIPWNKRNHIHSIRTDTCFIAYRKSNCKGIWSMKYASGDTILFSNQIGEIASFHVCTEEEGGNQLNLDLVKFTDYPNFHHDVLQSYNNVCSCVNVPKSIQNMSQWSINNHHNDLLAYNEPNCSKNKWNSTFIPAGRNMVSTHMHIYHKTDPWTKTIYKIQSFGPDPNSTYFKIGCNSTQKNKAGNKISFDITTDNVSDFDAMIYKQVQGLTSQLFELRTKQE